MNEVLSAIANRRSIRNYTDTPVTDEQLSSLIDAALQAPSGVNRQPYHFTFVRDAALLKEFSEDDYSILSRKNPDTPKDFDVLRGAPMVCFIFARTEGNNPLIDSGIAVQNLALAAYSMGLGSVILGMPRDVFAELGDKWYKKLQAPDDMRFAIAIGIGTPASSKDAHPIREGLVSVI